MLTDDHPNKALDFGAFAECLAHRSSGSEQERVRLLNMALHHADGRGPTLDDLDPEDRSRTGIFLSLLHEGRELLALMNDPRLTMESPQLRQGDQTSLLALLFDEDSGRVLLSFGRSPGSPRVGLALPYVHVPTRTYDDKSERTVGQIDTLMAPYAHRHLRYEGGMNNGRFWAAAVQGKNGDAEKGNRRWVHLSVAQALMDAGRVMSQEHAVAMEMCSHRFLRQ